MVDSAIAFTSLHLHQITRLPRFVEGRFGRAVQSENGEVPLARSSGVPGFVLAVWGFRPLVEVGAGVGVLHRLVPRPWRREGLAKGQP